MHLLVLGFLTGFAFLPLLQEKIEDNAWLRYKPGTWIRSKFTMERPDGTFEDMQTLTLKSVDGDDYVVEESYAAPGSVTSVSKRSRGVTVGTETIKIAGKDYDCRVSTVKGSNSQGPTEGRFWTPLNSRNAVKIAFKQKDSEGELLATTVGDKVKVLDRTLVCNTLKGKVKFGETEGVLTLLLSEDIPGAQVRADVVLKGTDGETRIRFEAKEMLEKK